MCIRDSTHTINIINSNVWHILVSLQLIIMIHKYFWVVFNKCIVAHFSVEFLHRLSCILSLLVPSLLTWNFLSCEPYKLSLVSFSTFCIKPSYLVATWCIDWFMYCVAKELMTIIAACSIELGEEHKLALTFPCSWKREEVILSRPYFWAYKYGS